MSTYVSAEILSKVRGAIARVANPFTAFDLIALFGYHRGGANHNLVCAALRVLTEQGELESEIVKRPVGFLQGSGRFARYTRTPKLRAESFDPAAHRFVVEHLQRLALEWGYVDPARAARLRWSLHAPE